MDIASRIATWAKSGGTWTNPYVTDGLIAMWDGEWNAGGGVHDANATIWKDLVGTNDFGSFVNGVYFNDKSIHIPATQNAAIGSSVYETSNIATIECVCSLSAWNGLVLVGFSNQDYNTSMSRWVGFRSNGTINFSYQGVCANAGLSQNSMISFTGLMRGYNLSECPIYRNGQLLPSAGNGMTWSSTQVSAVTLNPRASTYSDSNIASIRLYSRALTAAEIAANYAVDAARFNLS